MSMEPDPLEQWLGIDAKAAEMCKRLGLNPMSYRKLRVALGLAGSDDPDTSDS